MYRTSSRLLSTSGRTYQLLLVPKGEFLQHFLYFFVEIVYLLLPFQIEEVHLCSVCLFQLPQLILVAYSNLIHFAIFEVLPELLHLALEPFGLNVLATRLTVFLPGYCLLS